MAKNRLTKKEARAQVAAWRRAVSEGRVVKFMNGAYMQSYHTVAAAQAAARDLGGEIVVPPPGYDAVAP